MSAFEFVLRRRDRSLGNFHIIIPLELSFNKDTILYYIVTELHAAAAKSTLPKLLQMESLVGNSSAGRITQKKLCCVYIHLKALPPPFHWSTTIYKSYIKQCSIISVIVGFALWAILNKKSAKTIGLFLALPIRKDPQT